MECEADIVDCTPDIPVAKIIGLRYDRGELQYVMRNEDSNNIVKLPSSVARERFPQEIIKYYEERIIFAGRKTSKKQNREPQSILDIITQNGNSYYVMKWKDVFEMSAIPKEMAHAKYPSFVRKFYEERTVEFCPIHKRAELIM